MKNLGTKLIETENLILRKFRIEDATDFYNNWASDKEVTKFLTWSPHPSEEFTREYLEFLIGEYNKDKNFNWAIVDKRKDMVIGNISVVRLNDYIEEAEIGYCLSRSYWGQGLMGEALKAVIKYLFDEVEANRITATHDVSNPNSGRVMEKVGMKKEGVLRQAGKSKKGFCDVAVYSILKDELR